MRQLMVSAFILVMMSVVTLAADDSVFKDLSLSEAVTEAQSSHHPVLVKFYATWCGYCKAMDKNTFVNSEVRKTLENYVPIAIDVESAAGQRLSEKYQIRGIPAIAIFDETGELISIRSGYQDPATFLNYLSEAHAPAKP